MTAVVLAKLVMRPQIRTTALDDRVDRAQAGDDEEHKPRHRGSRHQVADAAEQTDRRNHTDQREPLSYLKMFTARAVTSRMLIAETPDSESISSFAQGLSGIASVGLNAIEFVKET
jgi:hypothetical protein